MGRFDGKVAVISGVARGQGRSHAVELAREGATIVGFDICDGLRFPLCPPATEEDLFETKRLIEEHGGKCLLARADARDLGALTELADDAMETFGRVDILLVNHGIWVAGQNSWEVDEESWQESVDVLLTGAWKVCKAFVPPIIDGGRGGSVILTSSVVASRAQPGGVAYTASKHGLTGLMGTLAHELGCHDIRVNTVNPSGVATKMIQEGGTLEKLVELDPEYFDSVKPLLPEVGDFEPKVISDAVLWLASDEARYVTGITLPVDAGVSAF